MSLKTQWQKNVVQNCNRNHQNIVTTDLKVSNKYTGLTNLKKYTYLQGLYLVILAGCKECQFPVLNCHHFRKNNESLSFHFGHVISPGYPGNFHFLTAVIHGQKDWLYLTQHPSISLCCDCFLYLLHYPMVFPL